MTTVVLVSKNIPRAVSDTEYSEGDDNSGRGLSAREEGLTTSVGDPGFGSAYFYRDPDPQIWDPDPHIFTGIQIRDPRSAGKQCGSPTLLCGKLRNQHWKTTWEIY